MKKRKSVNILIVASLFLVLILTAFQSVQAAGSAGAPAGHGKHGRRLTTASVVARLSNQPKRLIVSARKNHFVVDSIPPLGGTNEELNPVDLLVSSLAACGTFVVERAAHEKHIDLEGITTTAQGDFNILGLLGQPVDPRFQAFRVHIDVPGATEEQLEQLVEAFKARCLVYATLSRSAPVEITTNEQQPSPPTEGLNTASAEAQLSNQPGRAIVSVQDKHFVADAMKLLGGPNQELNSLDMTLSALATCATILYEDEAIKQGVPLTAIAATVEADYDRRGVKRGRVDPRIQAFRVIVEMEGPTAEQAEDLEAGYVLRCPLYTTLVRAAPIEIVHVTH